MRDEFVIKLYWALFITKLQSELSKFEQSINHRAFRLQFTKTNFPLNSVNHEFARCILERPNLQCIKQNSSIERSKHYQISRS